jgi:radical SAM protein with 4Fe4S-binding SPASM domain
MLGTKDNLFNVLRYPRARPLGRGCSGFGCAPAFNGLVLLPDGEVHVCRKFPSPLGSIRSATLGALYDSALAERYRQGPIPCRPCVLRSVCGGCLASTFGAGGDVFTDRAPYCCSGPWQAKSQGG